MKEKVDIYALKFERLTKRVFFAFFLLISAFVLMVFALADLNDKYTTKIATYSDDQTISIEGRPTATASLLIAPYETVDTFVSEEQSPGFEFTSVGGTWIQQMPHGTMIESEIRFKVDGKWEDWLHLDAEDDLFEPERKAATASSNPATAMQYKFTLFGDGSEVPYVKNAEWTFIKTGETISYFDQAPTNATAQFAPVTNYDVFKSQVSSNVSIIPRSGWGANENLRYLDEDYEGDAQLIELDDDFYAEFADELGYSLVVDGDSDGDFIWPLQYPQDVKKFVIHHTATSSNLDNPKQAIRDIYFYHAVSRGWGDIGYNYIIDQDGLVYEGRYGGEGVIGAHAGPANNGSIGISVLGNYEENELPEESLISLANLIGQKAKIHDIEPDGYSTFRGQLMPNVFGHKDVMGTSCPGKNIYSQFTLLRTLAAEASEEKEKFVKDWDYENLSDIFYLQLKPDDKMEVELKLENIGNKDWDSDTFLYVSTNKDISNIISLPGASGTVLTKLEENEVESGEVGTFKFDIEAGKKGDLVELTLALYANGDTKMTDTIKLPVIVEQTEFKYSLEETDYPPSGMEAGEEFQATVELKNTGNTTWTKTGDNKVVLQADHKVGRKSNFLSPAATTMGYMEQDEVAPGETATFKMDLVAPEEPGYYQEYFTPYVINENLWMADIGMYFDTVVYADEYAAEFFSLDYETEWTQEKSYQIQIKVRNLGGESWTEDEITLHMLRDKDLKITNLNLAESKVQTGDLATIRFTVEAPSTEQIGHKAIIVRPKIKGQYLLKKPIVINYKLSKKITQQDVWDQTVQVPTDAEVVVAEELGDMPDMRIKLSFNGNPKITADETFTIYDGYDEITSLSAGEEAEVIGVNGKYQVKTDSETYIAEEEVRFIAQDDGILEITNFDNAPAWNDKLNDNVYRGILEVREIDENLVVINEIPLEYYLRGLGEVSNSEEPEKIKAIITAARTYAYFYTENNKFPGKPYHLDDDPDVSQKYLGYGFEMRSPAVTQGVIATAGQVVTYNGKLIKTPYFNQSDGVATKSAEEVWGWTDTPYLISVDDSFCEGDIFYGHGVGMSGCGAKGMAKLGHTYIQILKHYYTGAEVSEWY